MTLSQALEGGVGGRELDALIWTATTGEDVTFPFGEDDGPYTPYGNGMWAELAKLTTSLDAAVALAERALPGWSWEVRRSGFGNPAQARLYDHLKSPSADNGVHVFDNSGSAPLALCRAILQAHEGNNG
jgi:hypothetical protein